MAFLGLLPVLLDRFRDKRKKLSTSILLAEEKERRKAHNRVNRASTNRTGGLSGVQPTVSRPALWGVA